MQSYRQLVEQAKILEKHRGLSLDFTDKKIVDSWVRCFENGLNPRDQSVEAVLSNSELNEAQEK